MGLLTALGAGLADLRHRRRLWPGLYAVQAVLAMLLVLPVWAGLDRELGHRPQAAARLAGGDLGLLDELLGRLGGNGSALLALLPVVLLLGYLVRLFLLGGTLRALARPGTCLTVEEFLAASGRTFMPLSRLAAFFAVGHLLAFGTIGGLAYAAHRATEGALWPMAPEMAMAGAALPGLLFWLLVATAHDYARVQLVQEHDAGLPELTPWRRGLRALRSMLGRPLRPGLHLLSLALGIAVLAIGATAARWAGPLEPLWVAAGAAFLLRQATGFVRTGIHLARYSSVLLLAPAPPAPATPAARQRPATASAAPPLEELVTM